MTQGVARARRNIDGGVGKRIFELYASGAHSLVTLRKAVLNELGTKLSRAYFETLLKNRFYLGYFTWQGTEYKGQHAPLISADLLQERKRLLSVGTNRSIVNTTLLSLACLRVSMMAVL